MAEERTTIRQLARLSGVSIGTVSRALNGYADVRPETRERIVRLARELDYTPAAAARTLVTQRSHVIGVFLETGEGHPDLQHPFFHEVLVGCKDRLGAQGFDLLLFASSHPGNGYGEHSYLKRCRHHNVDGVVLMGVDAEDDGAPPPAARRPRLRGSRRRAARCAHELRDVRQRRRRRGGGSPPAWPGPPQDRDGHRAHGQEAGSRPAARLSRRVRPPGTGLSRRVRRARGLLLRGRHCRP